MEKIFVMGGGGFSMEPENPLLDSYALSLTEKTKPRVCFLATASGDSLSLIESFYKAFNNLDCIPTHLSLFKPPSRDLSSFVLAQDLIYVGGGNTKNLLSLWRDWKLDQILKMANTHGTVLAGLSAGMICWFDQGVTDSFGGNELDLIDGLSFLPGSACPHFDGEAKRKPYYSQAVKKGLAKGGIALDDGAGALYIKGQIKECVSSRLNAGAYLIAIDRETPLTIRYLG